MPGGTARSQLARRPTGRRRRAGRALADRRDDPLAVVAFVELEARDLQRHGASVPAEHLERERRAGHVLLDDDLVAGRLERARASSQSLLVAHDPHALAAAGRAGLDHEREPALGPRARTRHVEALEQRVGGELGRRDGVRLRVEQQRHVPGRHVRGEPGEGRVVLAGGEHRVAGAQDGAAATFVGGHVHDDVTVGEARRRRGLATVDEHRLVPGLGGEVRRLDALELAADDRQSHAEVSACGAPRSRASVSR